MLHKFDYATIINSIIQIITHIQSAAEQMDEFWGVVNN